MEYLSRKNTMLITCLVLIYIITLTGGVLAHFQMILPSDDMVMQQESRTINLHLLFTHPMSAAEVMDMKKPVEFGVYHGGQKDNLLDNLKPVKIKGGNGYTTTYQIQGFGDFIFYLEPAPYWEPSEDCYITHCTKVVVNSMAVSNEWDQELGMKAEIVPLTRPYGLWTGNSFRGIVKKDGKPVPFAKIEVEYFNQAKFPELVAGEQSPVNIPNDNFITQEIKADQDGVFSYSIPRAGWWGFAALMEGKPVKGKDHELGALFWVKTYDMD